jgi:hypothetical protein
VMPERGLTVSFDSDSLEKTSEPALRQAVKDCARLSDLLTDYLIGIT